MVPGENVTGSSVSEKDEQGEKHECENKNGGGDVIDRDSLFLCGGWEFGPKF